MRRQTYSLNQFAAYFSYTRVKWFSLIQFFVIVLGLVFSAAGAPAAQPPWISRKKAQAQRAGSEIVRLAESVRSGDYGNVLYARDAQNNLVAGLALEAFLEAKANGHRFDPRTETAFKVVAIVFSGSNVPQVIDAYDRFAYDRIDALYADYESRLYAGFKQGIFEQMLTTPDKVSAAYYKKVETIAAKPHYLSAVRDHSGCGVEAAFNFLMNAFDEAGNWNEARAKSFIDAIRPAEGVSALLLPAIPWPTGSGYAVPPGKRPEMPYPPDLHTDYTCTDVEVLGQRNGRFVFDGEIESRVEAGQTKPMIKNPGARLSNIMNNRAAITLSDFNGDPCLIPYGLTVHVDKFGQFVPVWNWQLLPPFRQPLQEGENPVRIRNPNAAAVVAGIRRGAGGRDFYLAANSVKTVKLPNGKYTIVFVHANEPDKLLQGESFTLADNGVEIFLIKVVGGNYGLRSAP